MVSIRPEATLAGTRSSTWRGAAACLTTALIWSGNAIVTKAAAGVIAPGSIAFYRWVVAFLMLSPFVALAAWRNRMAAFRQWKRLLVLGALGMVLYQTLAYEAAETTSAINIGLILALSPLISTLLASAYASERLTVTRVSGAAVSLAGLIYLTSRGEPSTLLEGGLHIGDGLMLIAVVCNALYGILIKRWSVSLPLLQQLFWQILFSVLLLVPIWLSGPVSPITGASLPLIIYAAIPASLLAPMCWIVGIQRLGAARSGLFINLVPLVVAGLAWSLLGERLHDYHWIGGIVALLGVAIGLRETKPDFLRGAARPKPAV